MSLNSAFSSEKWNGAFLLWTLHSFRVVNLSNLPSICLEH